MPATERLHAVSAAEKALCALLVIGTLLYCGGVFLHYAENVGQADDFVDALWFIEIFRSRDSFPAMLAVMFLPNHEHITLFNHLVYVIDYAVTGKISFLHCMVLGQGIVLACCVVLAGWLRRWLDAWYAAAMAVTLFYNLFYWHAGFWAMTALSNQGVILFALLAARSAAQQSDAVFMPLLWSLAAVATQFNGLLVLPALLAGRWWVQQRGGEALSPRQAVVWGAAAVVSMLAYVSYENPFAADHLWRYVNYTDPDHLADYIKPTGQPLSADAYNWLWALQTVLALAGATVFGLQLWQPAALLGAVLVVWLLRNSWRGNAGRDSFFMVVLCFVAASVVLVGVGRGIGFGPDAGMLFRYRLYPFLLLVLLAGAWIMGRRRRTDLIAVLGLGLLVQVLSWHVLDDIASERSRVQRSHYFWLIDGGMGRSEMPFYPHNQDWRLFNAYQGGYYNPYDAIDARNKPVSVVEANMQDCRAPLSGEGPAVTAWSKKARALAVEIRVAQPLAVMPAALLFCAEHSAHRLVLGQHNVDGATMAFHPLLALKKDLPPAEYRVLWQWPDGTVRSAGTISFP